MHSRMARIGAFAVISVAVTAISLKSTVGQDSSDSRGKKNGAVHAADDSGIPVDPEETLRKRVLDAAKDYKSYGRVDDEARWAPYLCRMPMPSSARISASEDDATHGASKLYFMFAKERAAYVNVGLDKVPDIWKDITASQAGQIIVKESWKPKETDRPIKIQRRQLLSDKEREQAEKYVHEETRGTHPFAEHEGKTYYAAEKAGLFLMLRADENNPYETENSVKGWVFATTTPDGEEITALGKIESCVGCHQDAPHNGLFGIPGEFTRW